MSIETEITRLLGIAHPILLAPMALVSDARLTAAVSAAGGLGILGGGYGEQDWLSRELNLLEQFGARFGVGFITWSLAKQPKLLDLALERKPVAVMLSFGDPTPFVQAIKRAGALAICQVQSLAMAKHAVKAGADVLVVQGTEAGGHGASRGLFALLPEVADTLGPNLPLLAAGGIADGRGLAAALTLGACGVLMGTRFYATQEAAGADEAKQRMVDATGDDTLRCSVLDIVRRKEWPAPFTVRCLRNEYLERWQGREEELKRRVEEEYERYAVARQEGNFDIAIVVAGESMGMIHDIPAVRSVIDRVMAEAAERLGRLRR
jgi:nitronate monooxygenase